MRLHLLLFLACLAVVAVQRSTAPESRLARREYTRNRGGGGASGTRSHTRTQARRRTDRQGRSRRGPTSRAESTRRTSIDVSIRHTYRADSTRQSSRADSPRQRSRADSPRQRSRADSPRQRTRADLNRQSTGSVGSVVERSEEEAWPTNCTRCAERQEIKRWRLDLIKSEILQKLRLEAPPNITSRNMPEILNETLYPYLQMDQAVSDQAFEGDDFHATKLKIVTIGQARKYTYITGMDKTSLDTSSGTLFVRDSGCPDVHVTSDVITYHCSAWTQSNVDLRNYVISRQIVI